MKKIDKDRIFLSGEENFEALALEVFRLQATDNPVYARYLAARGIEVDSVNELNKIPFLPVEFFKRADVITGKDDPEVTFYSSGTTGSERSRHLVTDLSVYEESYRRGFGRFYGDPSDYVILALLPSYLEREGSSLIGMVEGLIRDSRDPHSGFYLYDHEQLFNVLRSVLEDGKKKVLLIGVSFALLDFAETYRLEKDYSGRLIVMETGGMKGRRKEVTREELHAILKESFCVSGIHSEYGMTELLSQAYSRGNGLFRCPPWMKILLRDADDPFSVLPAGTGVGGINIVDLANINSCSFIAVQDLGRLHTGGFFEVLGRMQDSELRGCNLLLADV